MISILMTNNTRSTLQILDLGIELPIDSNTSLSSFSDKKLLSSVDLITAINSGDALVTINSVQVNYKQFVSFLTKLSEPEHDDVTTLTHELSQHSYFEVTKDANNRALYVTHYSDSNKTNKLREEEISRDLEGRVSEIIIRQYDSDGILKTTDTQILNRGTTGRVESISSNKIDAS